MPLGGYSPDAGMTLFASGGGGAGVTAANVSVWHLNPIWVSPEDVLARRDELERRGRAE